MPFVVPGGFEVDVLESFFPPFFLESFFLLPSLPFAVSDVLDPLSVSLTVVVVPVVESFDVSSTSLPQSSEEPSSPVALLVLVLEDVSDVVLVVEDVSDVVVVLLEDVLDVDVLPVPADPTLPRVNMI